MKPRMEYWKVAPRRLQSDVFSGRLPSRLRPRQALAAQRLYGLDAWREAPYYTNRERAALEWTEALTNVTDGHVPDAIYDAVRGHFPDKDLADPAWAVVAINAGNRVSIAFRSEAARTSPGRAGERSWRTAPARLAGSLGEPPREMTGPQSENII